MPVKLILTGRGCPKPRKKKEDKSDPQELAILQQRKILVLEFLYLQILVTGWTVRGSNPGGGEIFRTCLDRPWGTPSLLYNDYRVFTGDKERPGRDADPSPPSSAAGHERVELYLYSSHGPYGLYRASVPVQ
jgi:hypothetical protein